MSVTIRYYGSLAELGLLQELQDEFLDISATSRWPNEIVNGAFTRLRHEEDRFKAGFRRAQAAVSLRTLAPPLVLRGIKIYPHPQTDPLWFTFDEQGVLTRLSYYALDHYTHPLQPGPPRIESRRFEFVHQSQASIQTSIGGFELHRTVVALLQRLRQTYVPGLQVMDDSGYWESQDEKALRRIMARP